MEGSNQSCGAKNLDLALDLTITLNNHKVETFNVNLQDIIYFKEENIFGKHEK